MPTVSLKVALKMRESWRVLDEDGDEVDRILIERTRNHKLYRLIYTDGSVGIATGSSKMFLIPR